MVERLVPNEKAAGSTPAARLGQGNPAKEIIGMPGEKTPAEKSADQMHMIAEGKTTYCGISFRRQRFMDRNITSIPEHATCSKCVKARTDLLEEQES